MNGLATVEDHIHDGVGSKKLSYDDLSDLPTERQYACSVASRQAGAGTGTAVITTGFLPAFIRIRANGAGDTLSYSEGASKGTTSKCCISKFYNGSAWQDASSGTNLIEIYDSAGNLVSAATVSAVSATSFTLNFTTHSAGITYLWEASN
jgi:hypothetical protein